MSLSSATHKTKKVLCQQAIKYIGLMIDEKLSFKEHLSSITNKS